MGDQIELRRPDGAVLKTNLAGIEHARGLDGKSYWPLRLPPNVTEADVPAGREVPGTLLERVVPVRLRHAVYRVDLSWTLFDEALNVRCRSCLT